VAFGQQVKLLLSGDNTLKGGSIYNDSENGKIFVATAGVHVPAGANLIIDKDTDNPNATDENSILRAIGFTAPGGNFDMQLGSFGAAAGIGGGHGGPAEASAAAGSIVINGGTIIAQGGGAGGEWSGAAGIGGGGQISNYNSRPGAPVCDIYINYPSGNSSGIATPGANAKWAVGPCNDGDVNSGSFNGQKNNWPVNNPFEWSSTWPQ